MLEIQYTAVNMLSNLNTMIFFFFSSRRRHTRFDCDWSSDVCSSDLEPEPPFAVLRDKRPTDIDAINARRGQFEDIFARLADAGVIRDDLRSEERRVGKECRSRWSPYH